MNRSVFLILAGALTCASGTTRLPSQKIETNDDARAVLQGDHALMQAFAGTDTAGVDQLLDKDFVWIDSNGRIQTRAQVLEHLPTPANAGVEVQERTYGESAVVRANQGRVQVVRVWAKRGLGWKVVLYQEVTLALKSEPPWGSGKEASDCENPCKKIPFQPETPSEQEVIASWQGVMRSMAANDADAYAPLIADEFTATDTHHDRAYTKADRLAQIQKQKQTGAHTALPALISASMFDFGETVLMIAREQRTNAKAYFNSRMWVKRGGRWQMLFSMNTRIE
jgi:hypothetical protein